MKNLITILSFIFVINTAFSQNSWVIHYKGTAKDRNGKIISDKKDLNVIVALNFVTNDTIARYVESHIVNTSRKGIYYLNIGKGQPITGSKDNLPWKNTKSYAKITIDGVSSNFFEVHIQRDYSNLNNPKLNNNINSGRNKLENIPHNSRPLRKVTIGQTQIKPGTGISFYGKKNNFSIINNAPRITFETDENIQITGKYPHFKIALKKHHIGEKYLGGIVIKVDESGLHGTVAKVLPDLHTWTTIIDFGKITPKNSVLKRLNLKKDYAGKINTLYMLMYDTRDNFLDLGETYSVTEIIKRSMPDWYLPSYNELYDIYSLNRKKAILNKELYLGDKPEAHIFWSSTEDLSNKIWKGHRDGPEGENYSEKEYPPIGLHVTLSLPKKGSKSYKDKILLKGGFQGVVGALAINFYTGKPTTILKIYPERVILCKDF